MATSVHEIADDVFRVCVYVPDINLEFNSFVVRDDEPLLFHTGMRGIFPAVKEGVAKVIDLDKLRWISWSHFEADECGALNEWLGVARNAEPVCSMLGALINVNDFSSRPARFHPPGESFGTGKHRFQYIPTPHVPHGWDAGVLWEQTGKTLFCSDLFHQEGVCVPLTFNDVLGRARETLIKYESSPLAGYVPYNHNTARVLHSLSALKPETLATMHGSSFRGDCETALRDLDTLFREVLGKTSLSATAG